MGTVNKAATHKFVIVLNEKSPIGKLLSAVGQLAMSLQKEATAEQRQQMDFIPFLDPSQDTLIQVSTCSLVVLKGTAIQLLNLYSTAKSQKVLSALFTSTMSYNGVEEDLIHKTATTPLTEVEPYAVGLFAPIETLAPLTKKFSVFK